MFDQDQSYTVDINIENLFQPDVLEAAAETEDEIGCVLRIHLLVEQLLNFYIDQKRVAEIKPFIKEPREFNQKLALATAFGMPTQFAAVAHQINNIRNKSAHRMSATLGDGDVQQLARLVNKMIEIQPEFNQVEKTTIQISRVRPDEVFVYDDSGNRIKFLISSLCFWRVALGWLLKDAAFRKLKADKQRV